MQTTQGGDDYGALPVPTSFPLFITLKSRPLIIEKIPHFRWGIKALTINTSNQHYCNWLGIGWWDKFELGNWTICSPCINCISSYTRTSCVNGRHPWGMTSACKSLDMQGHTINGQLSTLPSVCHFTWHRGQLLPAQVFHTMPSTAHQGKLYTDKVLKKPAWMVTIFSYGNHNADMNTQYISSE